MMQSDIGFTSLQREGAARHEATAKPWFIIMHAGL